MSTVCCKVEGSLPILYTLHEYVCVCVCVVCVCVCGVCVCVCMCVMWVVSVMCGGLTVSEGCLLLRMMVTPNANVCVHAHVQTTTNNIL